MVIIGFPGLNFAVFRLRNCQKLISKAKMCPNFDFFRVKIAIFGFSRQNVAVFRYKKRSKLVPKLFYFTFEINLQ